MSSEKKSLGNPTAPVMTPPDDTPSFAGNYGLDGFNFYDDYGEGVKDSQRLPQTKGRSGLPDGMIDPSSSGYDEEIIEASMPKSDSGYSDAELGKSPGHSDLGDLGGLMHTANTVQGPVDFSWLEGVQDPERLPEQPCDKALEGIQRSWGQRTDGQTLHRVPGNTRHPTFLESLVDFGQKEARQLARMAMRRSASGEDFQSIIDLVNKHIAGNTAAVRVMTPILKKIASEHKLAGRVFVRAEAYPGCHNQKWKESLTKSAGAMFVVTAAKCGSCVQNQNGRCAALNKKLVDVVPWDLARKAYGEKFAAVGIKVAATENPRRDLKKAFSMKAERDRGLEERPTHNPLRVASEKEAMEALVSSSPKTVEVLKDSSAARKLASRKGEIERLAKAGYFNPSQLTELMGESCPDSLATKAAKMVQAKVSTQNEYEGATFTTHQSSGQDSAVTAREVNHVLRWASQQMSQGLFGESLNSALSQQFSEGLLSASQDKLKLIRQAHEGLSGDLYAHAAAFVRGLGIEGCVEGAKKVASQGLRNVLAMDKCAGCLQNTGGNCVVYRGTLVASARVKDVKAYQREKLASGSKVSLNVYQQGVVRVASSGESVDSLEQNLVDEFGLGGSSLDNIQYNPESEGEIPKDSEFTFGGMVL